VILEGLRGKRVLVTGVTGFVGQALLERLLSNLHETHVSVLIRPRGSTSASRRLQRLLDGAVFADLRDRLGETGLQHLLEERVRVVEGRLDEPPELPGDLDVVCHCAATVSFDPPIDEAFATNLLGTVNLYRAVHASGSPAHLVHVSTAYVAGIRQGLVHERSLEHQVDWRAEADAAQAARGEVERLSRHPRLLDRFVRDARREHNRAGPQTVSADAERRRVQWVTDRLVEHGRARAQSLGWPDVYTFTKALGERAAEEIAGDLPLSIVRPSIVESALAHPYPGWIEGFKMAEPIILAYGRGALPEFPGIPEGVVDIIPVDLVSNALLAVAATRPDAGAHRYYHVSSGARNPLPYRRLYELVRDYFTAHPLPESDRGEIKVPEWQFPGRARVERMLRTGERALDVADKAVSRLPRSTRTRELLTTVHRNRRKLDFMRRYADLYGAYAEAEVVYTDDEVLALHRGLPPDEQARFGFDAAAVDWRHYLVDVHCPSITASMRAVGRRPPARRSAVRASETPALAVFDLEGTIVASNVVESYVWLRLAELPVSSWPGELAGVARALPRYLATDRQDRAAFLRAFYRRYEGASVEGLQRLVDDHVAEMILRRLVPAAVRRVRAHRAAGHRTVLITGAMEPLVAPLRPLFDTVSATRLATRDGHYTGYLEQAPLVGEARATWLRTLAAAEALDLSASYGYGDSHSDLPMLQAVGNPVAVNPDAGLYRRARRHGWPVEEWPAAATAAKVAVPAGAAGGAPGWLRGASS
jgi:alcohol-forming fatty acyl-CoA reductase